MDTLVKYEHYLFIWLNDISFCQLEGAVEQEKKARINCEREKSKLDVI